MSQALNVLHKLGGETPAGSARPSEPVDAQPWEVSLYRILVQQAQVGLFVVKDGRLLFVNPRLAEMLGYREDELLGMPAIALTALSWQGVVGEQVRRRVAGVKGMAYDIQCQHKNGGTFDARVWGFRTELCGEPVDLVTLHDISELKTTTRSAERRAELLTQAEELAHIGSMEVDMVTGDVWLSVGMFQLFGEQCSSELVSRSWLHDRVPEDERTFVQSIQEGMPPGEPFEFEHRIVRRDGSVRTVLHRGLVEADAAGTRLRSRVILQDVTRLREFERVGQDLANLDSATLLPNRNALLGLLETAIQDAQRQEQTMALQVLAIDQVKLANETLGYAGGDLLLKAVSQRLSAAGPFLDTLAHLGGGEFAGLLSQLPEPAEASAQRLSLQLIEALAEPFHIANTEIFVTCSVGVALAPADAQSAVSLLDRAQSAMRQASAWGKNQVFFYTEQASERATSRLALESALRHALARKELYLCYQPQVDLSTGRIVSMEALARWHSSARGEVSPTEFIPLAEQTGQIISIGEWILRTACEDSVRWQAAGLPAVRVGVNLSIQQLQQPDIASRIQAILLETGMDPRRLGLEVTESMLLDNFEHVARTLSELKAIGVEISLDDFGTGYSNLGHLSKLPIDVLKIDRSFVHEVTAPTQDVSITRALISMAHGLHMRVVAEGVENESQLALLVASRCDMIQGFYFSRPVRFEGMATLLQEDKRLPAHLLERRARKRTLLLVDDEENVVSSLRRLLRKDGYHIITANSGAQGLQRLAENEVDVILSDQRMPGMTGAEFLRRAKELYPDTVRMSLSGYTELQSVTDAINEGAVYKFLTKPWDDERLRAHIADAFRHKEMTDENRTLGAQVRAANAELAQVNERLQRLLSAQSEQIVRDEARMLSVGEVLDGVPSPVIGFDVEGMVAFLNAEAQDLFNGPTTPLGLSAQEALPPELLRLWQAEHGAQTALQFAGRGFDVVCRDIGAGPLARGRLMVFTPQRQSSRLCPAH